MHELAIAQNILNIIERRLSDSCSKNDMSAVETVNVRIGEFRNVDPESLVFAFDGLKVFHETCRGCRLDIEVQAAQARCVDNNHLYRPLMDNGFRCTECGAGIALIECGEELEIRGYTLQLKSKAKDEESANA